MKNPLLFTGAIALSILASCGGNESNTNGADADTTTASTDTMAAAPATTDPQIAMANLASTKDSTMNIGSAKFFKQNDGQIRMELEINDKSRADSNVAVHFHEHGDCGNKGENTHGHWNPTKEAHGKWGAAAYHSGDIGNIQLDANGHATFTVTTDRWSTDTGSEKDIIGKGIIVHGGTDDYTTQPTGNSGPRVGCGVIMKQ